MDIAYYGDVFLPPPPPGKSTADLDLMDDLTTEEYADLGDAAVEAVPPEEIAAAASAEDKAALRTPLPLQAMLRALDRRFGASAGVLYLGEVRQVRRYLTDPPIKAEVDRVVDAAVTPDCRILIGHSLGSVVAWEFVRRHPEHHLDLLLTLGSPLGLRAVRRLLPEPDYSVDARPRHVASWVNVRDPRDPVCCAGDLRQWWSGLSDVPVNNQRDAHSAERYLTKRQVGEAIRRAAPDLVAP